MSETFLYHKKFVLESGDELPGFRLAYTTYGTLNKTGDNVIWIFHALTANSNPCEWWPGIIGNSCLFDPEEYFIICANMPGSAYGSLSPLDNSPETGKPYYHSFPVITIRDMVGMYQKLITHLQIKQIYLAIGGSMGGMQALELAIAVPELIHKLVLIATNARHSAWGIAFNAAQRMAIRTDKSWFDKNDGAGLSGLKSARAIAMLSYRNYDAYNETQKENDENRLFNFKPESYLEHQGIKLCLRFNAFSYYSLTKSMDTHNVGRNRTSISQALSTIKAHTLVIGIESDILFPIEEQLFLAAHIPGSVFNLIDSPLGHDGFLTEVNQVSNLVADFINLKKNNQKSLKPIL